MSQFGEVIHCHKPPYSGIPGEDFVNVRFATQEAADRAYEALKQGQCHIDGFLVGVGQAPKPLGSDAQYAIANGQRPAPAHRPMRSPSPPRRYARGVGRDPGTKGGDSYQSAGEMYRGGGGGGGGGYQGHRGARSPPRRGARDEPRANFPSRGDPKSPSPRRMAKEMGSTRKSRSRSRGRKFAEPPALMGYGAPTRRAKSRSRTPSPDPPGPMKITTLVKNPFYRPNRSPDRE